MTTFYCMIYNLLFGESQLVKEEYYHITVCLSYKQVFVPHASLIKNMKLKAKYILVICYYSNNRESYQLLKNAQDRMNWKKLS